MKSFNNIKDKKRKMQDGNKLIRSSAAEYLTFADFFFDGFLADVFVQSKISDAKRNVEDAISRVQNIVSRLQQELR